jgi:hypothetical protein
LPLGVRPEPGRLERSRRKGMRLYQEGRSRKRPPLSICRSAPRVAGAGGRVGRRLARIPRRSALGARRWVGEGVTSCPGRRTDRSHKARPLTRASLAGRSTAPDAPARPVHRPALGQGLLRPPARGGVCGLGRFRLLRLGLRAGRGEALRCRPCCGLRVTTGARDVVTPA